MLTYKPHQALVYRATTANSNDYVSLGITVQGCLEPQQKSIVYAAWGLDPDDPAVWFMDLNSNYDPKIGDRLLVDSAYWEIVVEPMRFSAVFYLNYQKMLVKRVGDY